MQIPDKFIQEVSINFGEAGVDWVQHLPGYVCHCQEIWDLTQLRAVENLSINLVCSAQSGIYGDVVLKLQSPHAECQTEVVALQLFEGRNVCKLHAVDQDIAALLLERILPGNNLRALPDRSAQVEIGEELVAQLPVRANRTDGLPTYQEWINNALEIILPQFEPDQRFFGLMKTSEELINDICPPGSPQYLLHGDLHHDNILQSHGQGWKVIDPHGVFGLPFMESARFIQNHILGENHDLLFDDLDEIISFFARRLEQSKRLIASALFVLHVLSTSWDVEMNHTQDQIANRIDECELLLEYLNGSIDS
jgi:streptomycin 6-kinase